MSDRAVLPVFPVYTAGFLAANIADGFTDWGELLGHADVIVVLLDFQISGVATTTTAAPIAVLKRSPVNTGGTKAASTIVKHNSDSVTPRAVFSIYSANATVGVSKGIVWASYVTLVAAATSAPGRQGQLSSFESQSLLLKNSNESFNINLNAVAYVGGLASGSITWMEIPK